MTVIRASGESDYLDCFDRRLGKLKIVVVGNEREMISHTIEAEDDAKEFTVECMFRNPPSNAGGSNSEPGSMIAASVIVTKLLHELECGTKDAGNKIEVIGEIYDEHEFKKAPPGVVY